ncbi:Acg family FMN-binding oxidoreductase [Mycolicibacterium confluentis]|uniref:Putative NAD(P)H nitroreductase acg n=1 Tax=Mycolicibacterium confluentis TaxID=28047 RepID=A0A7I7XUU5_9MYCO|nr:NAD(P)H nitroreductase [Mycolicibacterium confluentis]MCV7322288.1 NAD(P)H nitroreductase [Mycolicibacterium confluentis]ORV28390.1 NAD(P)H nitroreductase [Mycolicibacterium confluentis]BBZ33028.1 putative NAD(P)H nitroreductase acg [Mycolicibacterium confluentis]
MAAMTLTADVLRDAVGLACRAPSYHNSQPWRWVADGAKLQLFLDRSHVVANDHSGRQALLSCGAALDHVQVAMAAQGWQAHVELLPNPNNLDHLATLGFTELVAVTDGHRRLAEAISRRRTDRLPFGPVPDWERFEERLRSRIDTSFALLDVISDADRPQLVAATEFVDALRLYDSQYFRTLQWWTTPYEADEGIPYSALVSAAEDDRVGVGRTFPVAPHSNRRAQIPEDRSAIVVLSAHEDTRRDILECGSALSTVLLEATLAGLASCPLTHLTEMATGRHIVSQLTDREYPQVLVRIGSAPAGEEPPPQTRRRPLADVLTVTT